MGLRPAELRATEPDIDPDVSFLFAIRHSMEKKLRRIASTRQIATESRRPLPVVQITRMLAGAGLLEPHLESAIREVYAVCSPAIHGEPVSDAQVRFVREVGPELVAALEAIR
jgi:hypothetical protein